MTNARRNHGENGSLRAEGDALPEPLLNAPLADNAVLGGLIQRFGLDGHVVGTAPAHKKRVSLLTRTIETQIVPKLVAAHLQTQAPREPAAHPTLPAEADLARFTQWVLANDLLACTAGIDALVASGVPMPQICGELLAPIARRLGEMWDDDLVSFIDVTAGLGTLHVLLRGLHLSCEPALPVRDEARQVLLTSLPGNQHDFGLHMVAEVFRHSGWQVTLRPGLTEAALAQMVAQNWFAVVGLSLASAAQTGPLALAIRAMRKASSNHVVGVIVGGPVFTAQPELAPLVGADLTASDAKQAVYRAEGLRVMIAALAEATPEGEG